MAGRRGQRRARRTRCPSCIQTIRSFIARARSIKTQNLQLNADIILEIYVSIKRTPIKRTRKPLCWGFMYIYQGFKKKAGEDGETEGGRERRGEKARVDFPTVYMLIFKLNSPRPGTIYTQNANHFLLSPPNTLFFSFFLSLSWQQLFPT